MRAVGNAVIAAVLVTEQRFGLYKLRVAVTVPAKLEVFLIRRIAPEIVGKNNQ